MKRFWFSCVLALALVALIALGFVPTAGRAESSSEHAPKAEHGAKAESEPKAEHGAKAEKGSSSEEATATESGVYIHLQPFVLPVIGSNGAEQLVTLLVDLQVKDLTVSEKIRQKMPRVQDAIVQALYGGLGDGTLREGNRVDIAKIKTKINVAIEKCMGERLVDDVLIQAVAQRAL